MGYEIKVGFEVEFVLYSNETNKPIEENHYASSNGLDMMADFFDHVTNNLTKLGIEVLLIHKEVCDGQYEITTGFGPVMEIADKLHLTMEVRISCTARPYARRLRVGEDQWTLTAFVVSVRPTAVSRRK